MEKIIFFGLVIPILGFVLYLGATAIMKGFSAKSANKANEINENEKIDDFSDDGNKPVSYTHLTLPTNDQV